jgi:CRP-like cAMP-binding protein
MTKAQSTIELLGRTRLFGGLGEAERAAVARQMHEVRFASGREIFARGDPGRDIYLVLEGRVRLSVLTAEGRELSFTHAGPGDIFGEIAALDGGVRTAGATAVAATRAMALGAVGLRRLLEDHPSVARAAIAFLCARLRAADQQLEVIALYPIEVRLARFLLAEIATLGGMPAKDGRIAIDVGMSQTELALRLGASRPKVNGALALLEDIGAIERDGSRIVCTPRELERIAERA